MVETAKRVIEEMDDGFRNADIFAHGILRMKAQYYRSYIRPILKYFSEIGTPEHPIKVGQRWHCPNCRSPISEGWHCCSYCGKSFKWQEDDGK